MRLMIAEDAEDLGRKAFELIEDALAQGQGGQVVLPTGNTPLGLYAEAARRGTASRLARARFIQLDEYLGLAPGDHRLLSGWLDRVLLAPCGIGRDRLVSFESSALDPDAEAARVETCAQTAGIDLAILGLGPNGHLGFNEPGSAIDSTTRVVALTPESIASNAVYWGGEAQVPRRAFTLGLGTLSRARIGLLLVSGAHKSAILDRVLNDAPSPDVPATCLRNLPGAVVLADRAAVAGSAGKCRVAGR